MSISIGNKITSKDSIVFMIDFSNKKSFSPNLLNYSSWVEDTSGVINSLKSSYGVSRYFINGNTNENVRVLGQDPFGYTNSVVWKSSSKDNPEGANGTTADGGWETDLFKIDNKKMYRFSVWTKRDNMNTSLPPSNVGYFYLGLYPKDYNSNNNGVYRKYEVGNISDTNPYFHINPDNWYLNNLNNWELVVGHVWPLTTTGSNTNLPGTNINGLSANPNHPDSGVWRRTNGKVSNQVFYTIQGEGNNGGDYIWKDTTTYAQHRSYLFYSIDPSATQSFIYPRVDVVDGTEPSISELLEAPEIVKDISKNMNKLYVKSVTNFDIEKKSLIFSKKESEFINGYMSSTFSVYSMNIWFSPGEVIDKTTSASTLIQLGKTGSVTNPATIIYLGNSTYGSTDENILIGSLYTYNESNSSYLNHPLEYKRWYNLCINWNGSDKYDVFINGELKTSIGTNKPTINCDYVSLGNRQFYNLPSTPFKGRIGSVTVYNKSLTNNEILENYNSTKPKYNDDDGSVIDDNLLLYLDATNRLSYPETGNTWYGIETTNAVLSGTISFSSTIPNTFNANSLFYSDLSLSLSNESVITLEVWIKVKSNSLGVILSFGSYNIWINSNGIGFNSAMGDLYGLNKSTIVDSWKQVTFVIRNGVSFSNNKIYLNGINQSLSALNSSQNLSNSTFTNQQRILGRPGVPSGHVDILNNVDVSIYRIYKRELSQNEIINNFNVDRNKFEI